MQQPGLADLVQGPARRETQNQGLWRPLSINRHAPYPRHVYPHHIARPVKALGDILAKHGMSPCKPSPLLMDPGLLSGLARMDCPPLTGVAKDVYHSLLGSLQYVAICTRLDVSTALSILGSTQAHPTEARF
jgi:hypothetical protein